MIKTKKYSNGLTLVVDQMQNYESVAFNMFVKTGSVNEKEGYYGISHFIEHMLFKGTKTRSALEISKTFDSLGANVNAYTDKEETTYFTKSTAENAEKCIEILSDMLFNSTFDEIEMKREKRVVIEEIKMYDDDAQSKAELMANQAFYAGNPFSRDVAGSIQSVRKLTQQQMFDYKNTFYVSSNITLSFAGNIDFKTAESYVEKYYLPFFSHNGKEVENSFSTHKNISFVKSYKKNAQSQVCISFKGAKRDGDESYVAKIFDVAFGLGMSSILFQRIREKLGLVYTITCNTYTNCAGGDMSIQFGTSTKNVQLALSAIATEIKEVKRTNISSEQFKNAVSNMVSTIKMRFENTSFVSLFNAKRLAFFGTALTKEEYIKNFEKITLADVQKYLDAHFERDNYIVSYVGENTRINLSKYFKL